MPPLLTGAASKLFVMADLTPVAGPSRPKRARKATAIKDDSEAEDDIVEPQPKRKRARKSKTKAASDDEADEVAKEVEELAAGAGEASTTKVKKPRAPRKAKLSGFTSLRCADASHLI